MTYRYPGGLVRRTAANTSITGASGVWDLGSQAQAVRTNTWPISGLANPVSGSLRFRDTASPYLNRTPAIAGNRRTWTWSGWVKRSNVSGSYNDYIFSVETGASERDAIIFDTSDRISIFPNDATGGSLVTTQVFRDFSSWYHIVVAVDTTQATASNRIKLYVNGVQVTVFGTATYPTQNYDWNVNNTVLHTFGDDAANVPTNLYHFNGYMAEINLIDGQALTPASFGQTSAITGVWEPIKYTGTYGTNGFYLSLSDTSSIGKDFSGNGNNWSPNNISTTSGATFDLMRDVPTQWAPQGVTDVGGTVRGNYCTWNPAFVRGNETITDGNLNLGTGTSGGGIGTIGVTTGKWYWESINSATTGTIRMIGILNLSRYDGNFGNNSLYWQRNGTYTLNNAADVSYGSAAAVNDVLGIALDVDAQTVIFYNNGVALGSAISISSMHTAGQTIVPAMTQSGAFNRVAVVNFGQRPFAYTPPSGFKSLCTTNLPTPTIGATVANAANKYFDATLYTGTGATLSVTNAGGFQPDFVWLKSRSATTNHQLFDAVRGTTKVIISNTTESESTSANTITSFNSGGFTVGTNTAINTSAATYVGWQWWAGGSTVTNTTGSISSQVRASTTAGFSVVTYIGNGTGGATIGHGLGAAPGMLMFKNRDETGGNSILVWHSSFTNQEQMLLSSTAAIYNPGNGLYFNSTTPGASVVTLGTSGSTNPSAVNMLMYAWAPIAGFSAFGSYTGNGSTNGPFIYTGFRPRYIMIKESTSTGNWSILDTSRSPYNAAGTNTTLWANLSNADGGASAALDILSNGFKIRDTDSDKNASSQTYIYMAFAEHPFKNSLAR
jgi:hypothetical protein